MPVAAGGGAWRAFRLSFPRESPILAGWDGAGLGGSEDSPEHKRSKPRILRLQRSVRVKSQASFFEAAKVALDSLRGSKLRSFLTLLGIILSTTTLISVMAVIHGMDVVV